MEEKERNMSKVEEIILKLNALGYNIVGFNSWAVVYLNESRATEIMHLGLKKVIRSRLAVDSITEHFIVYVNTRGIVIDTE